MRKDIRPSSAYAAGSWAVTIFGVGGYLVGLWNAAMPLNEKGYYFTLLLFGLFAAISLQKTVRDRMEGWPVTGIYFTLCWGACLAAAALLAVGLANADMPLSEKGFYAMAFTVAAFGAISVQKNIRDLQALDLPRAPETQEE